MGVLKRVLEGMTLAFLENKKLIILLNNIQNYLKEIWRKVVKKSEQTKKIRPKSCYSNIKIVIILLNYFILFIS